MNLQQSNEPKITKHSNFRVWLQNEFVKKTNKNPSYSLRAFANLLKMEASSVSQILNGKRKASVKVISHVCEHLGVNPTITNSFIIQSKKKFKKSKFVKVENQYAQLIAADAFSIISDWYHIALLELINVDGFNANPKWISTQLGITPTAAQIALDRLLRLGLVQIEDGRYLKTHQQFSNFRPGETSAAHKVFQKQILQLALDAIDNTPQEKKDITAITMAIDVDKIPEAKKMIAKFRRDFCTFVEDGHQTQVYELAVQFYPLSKNINPKENSNEL